MLGIITVVFVLSCAQALPSGVDLANRQQATFQRFDIEERIARDGYYSESYDVTTSDGYILEVNRIPFGRFEKSSEFSSSESRSVVFLMHGLTNSAVSFITLGPDLSLGYILADAGYDVWMGNARGVTNSRRHVYLDPDNAEDRKKFFDYTFEDIGTKDLPAMLDFVIETTGKTELNYIGHSQGSTSFLVLNSLKPEYNRIFKSVHLLAPVGYQDNFPTEALRIVARRTDTIYELAVRVGTVELALTNNDVVEQFENNPDLKQILPSFDIMGDFPLEILAPASIKQFAHYGQNIRDESFRRWNYGTIGNLLTYGRIIPPTYNLRLVNADITMHYSLGDILLSEQDVLDMARVLPNTKVRRVPRDDFTHTDFIISQDSKSLLAEYIVTELNEKNKDMSTKT